MTTIEIRDERAQHDRYTAYLDGVRIGSISSIVVHETVLLPHVEVDPGGHDLGIGSMLVRRAMDDARTEGHTALALCPFARRWVALHPSYLDVARRPQAGEAGAVNALVRADRALQQHGETAGPQAETETT
ncbi:MAG TPA: GNAT family N-acetyltransferase [Actinocrinis sp.]|nr:GNAT family N-acetyltransferase [Actinocrinis sp.]